MAFRRTRVIDYGRSCQQTAGLQNPSLSPAEGMHWCTLFLLRKLAKGHWEQIYFMLFFLSRGQLMAIFRFDTFDWWYILVVKEKEVLARQSLRIRGNLREIVIQTYKLVSVWLSKCILHIFYNTRRFQVYVVKRIMHPSLSSFTEKTQVQRSYLWNKKKNLGGNFISSNIFLYHSYLKMSA